MQEQENSTDVDENMFRCCGILNSIFTQTHTADIFRIMKFSLGFPAPKSLGAIKSMSVEGYQALFPNDGDFSAIENNG